MQKKDKNKEKRHIKLTPLENASILRKFTVLFILVSILPIGVLYYLYIQVRDYGKIDITETNFSLTLMLLIAGISVGYVVMRILISQIIRITEQNTKALTNVLGFDKVREFTKDQNEIAVLAHSFNEIILRLEENVRKLEATKSTLHSVMTKIGRGLSSTQNIDSFLELIVETVSESLSCDTGVLMLLDEEKEELYVKTTYGIESESFKSTNMKLSEGPFGTVASQRKPVIIPRSEYEDSDAKKSGDLFRPPLLLAPLLLHDKVLGVISASGRKTDESFKEDDLRLLLNVASQTAVAIENARLNQDVQKTYFETISALALAVEAKDRYSRGHLDRVADYVVKLGKKLNVEEKDIRALRDAARLHDIGKIGVLDEVLNKPGPLTTEEREIMQKHPEIGASIIMPVSSLKHLGDIIRQHHEFLDGSGYPHGLKGAKISLFARILTVADIYDALTSNRPYRKAFSKKESVQKLLEMKAQLDQRVVQALIEII